MERLNNSVLNGKAIRVQPVVRDPNERRKRQREANIFIRQVICCGICSVSQLCTHCTVWDLCPVRAHPQMLNCDAQDWLMASCRSLAICMLLEDVNKVH